jgi:hypothetical protein
MHNKGPIHIITLLIFIGISIDTVLCQKSIEGVYIGLEPIYNKKTKEQENCHEDSTMESWNWYHSTTIKIVGDSVFVDQNPIAICHTDTIESASDGNFYFYSGVIKKSKLGKFRIELVQIGCHYCGIPLIKQPDGTFVKDTSIIRKSYRLKTRKNSLRLNGIEFTKTGLNTYLCSQDPQCYDG